MLGGRSGGAHDAMSDGDRTDNGEPGTTRIDAERLVETSLIAAGGRWFATAVRHSALYRWLTAEPDPDVIVIDLRETWTVGPVIAVVDRVFGALEDAAPDSKGVALAAAGAERTLGFFEDRSWAELRQTRPVKLLVAALEPPEPPDSQQGQPADDGARGERDERDRR